jgi:hypothetical protein
MMMMMTMMTMMMMMTLVKPPPPPKNYSLMLYIYKIYIYTYSGRLIHCTWIDWDPLPVGHRAPSAIQRNVFFKKGYWRHRAAGILFLQ